MLVIARMSSTSFRLDSATRAIVISIRTTPGACSATAREFVVLTAGAYRARVPRERAAPRRLPGQRDRVPARHRAAQPRPKKWVHRLEAPAAASMRNQNAHERMDPVGRIRHECDETRGTWNTTASSSLTVGSSVLHWSRPRGPATRGNCLNPRTTCDIRGRYDHSCPAELRSCATQTLPSPEFPERFNQ